MRLVIGMVVGLLAGSEFKNNGMGYLVESALQDQIALLDWFETNVGRPRRR